MIQYANRSLFENGKQTQLFQMLLKKTIFKFKYEQWTNNVYTWNTCKWKLSNIVKHVQHDFENEMKFFVLNHDQSKNLTFWLMKQNDYMY